MEMVFGKTGVLDDGNGQHERIRLHISSYIRPKD
jgi:hypothetical protein